MYKVIGADQKEYGPVSAEQLRHWIHEGRVGPQTPIRAEDAGEWRPLSMFPEFAGDQVAAGPAAGPAGPTSPADFVERDYDLDLGGCIGQGWELLKNNFGLLLAGALIYFGIELAIGLLGAIPFVGPLFSLGNLFVVGPLLGGLYYLTLMAIRRQPATAGDVFAGFRTAYVQLFLGQLVPGLIAGLCLIPAVIAGLIVLLPSLAHQNRPGLPQLAVIGLVGLLCLVPMVFVQVNWMFTLPLIIDKRMDFWTAMRASWKMVRKHWWHLFGLVVLVGLVNVVGLLACCVGLLFTMPIGIGAMMVAYETIFSTAAAPAR